MTNFSCEVEHIQNKPTFELYTKLHFFQSDHKESSAWDVLNVTATKNYLPSEEDDPNFAVLTFELTMKRKLVFSSYILTLPCVFLASLTLVVFWLPPERPDRTALGEFGHFNVVAEAVKSISTYSCYRNFKKINININVNETSLTAFLL